ncbi:IS3 family transposase, partial [Chitinivibrio alkaliphilus]|uniref:IS3 family transposase n=1 Tax=Chitinivibrio alkaliphilus TaxID=1505232 RepID=UPI0012DE46F9
MSVVRCCRLFHISPSSYYYQAKSSDDLQLRQKMKEIAFKRRRFGYRRIHTLLQREGFKINHKRVYRLYREESLTIRKRKRKRYSKHRGESVSVPQAPQELWSMDFVHDALADGRKIRTLT